MTAYSWFKKLRSAGCCLLAVFVAGCATDAPRHDWEERLRGDAIVLLGEAHDNAVQHAQRLQVLRRAFAAGWRPVIAMEQFDRERQVDIERARREQPRDAQHVITLAATAQGAPGRGWHWDFYRPYIELALEYDVPLLAANVSSADTGKIMRAGFSAVFSAAEMAALGLNAAIPTGLQAAHEREIDDGHCRALPASLWPGMARAQLARDAFMAARLRESAGRGSVLLAGNGHVRKDIGAPQWLAPVERKRAFAVGYLEAGSAGSRAMSFDAVVWTAAATRADPCAELLKRGGSTK